MPAFHYHRLQSLAAASRQHRGLPNSRGPYYPHVNAAGYLELQDFDTGLRFDVAAGLFTIGSGSGSHVAYIPTHDRGPVGSKSRFVLQVG